MLSLQIEYTDGDIEDLNLENERFELIQGNSSAIEVRISYIEPLLFIHHSLFFPEHVNICVSDLPQNLTQDEEIDLPESIPLSEL